MFGFGSGKIPPMAIRELFATCREYWTVATADAVIALVTERSPEDVATFRRVLGDLYHASERAFGTPAPVPVASGPALDAGDEEAPTWDNGG